MPGGHTVITERTEQLSVRRSLPCSPGPPPDPEPLPLHDVPQLAQVGLGDDIIRFQLESMQVVGLRFRKLPVQVEDGPEVHQSSRVLREAKDTMRTGAECCMITLQSVVRTFRVTAQEYRNCVHL